MSARRKPWLIGLLALALLLKAYDLLLPGTGPSTESMLALPIPEEANPRQERALNLLAALPQLNFQVAHATPAFVEPNRNPFAFGAAEPPAAPTGQAVLESTPLPSLPAIQPVVEEPPPASFPGTLFGMVQDSRGSRAALWLDEQVYLIAPGETFASTYRLESIERMEVRLRDLAKNITYTLVLESDREALVP
jgi:hypothetical protein